MDYDGFLGLVEEGLAKDLGPKDEAEILYPEVFVTSVTTIGPPMVQESSDANKIEVVIKIVKEA